jgi:hypothetical protein
MYKVLVDHKITWRSWLRENTKGKWLFRPKTDDPDNYFFEVKEDADKFEAYVKEYVDNLKKEL